MELDLFAQMNNAAFRNGVIVGIIIAVLICGAIPIVVGANKGQPLLGIIGGLFAGGASVLLGCLGGLPTALFFVLIIVLVSGRERTSRKRRRRPRRYEYDYDDDEDDDYRPRRRSRRDDYDEEYEEDEGEDDRPGRRTRDW